MSEPALRDHRMRHVVQFVLNDCWLILPEKLEEILTFIEARAIGIDMSDRFEPRVDSREPKLLDNGLMVVEVDGTLAPKMNQMTRISGGTSTNLLAQQLRAAATNDAVKTVLLNIDSPGGAASGTPEAAAAVRQLAQSKRVVASAQNIMASGAYWLGSAANEVFASESTQVGSVGVYNVVTNVAEAAEKEGVKYTVIRAGDLKAAGIPYEPLTQERKASLQGRVDAIYQQFISAVADQRKTSTQTVLEKFGQGDVFLAGEATSRGMIDGVATFDEVVAREQERLARSSKRPVSIRVTENRNMSTKLIAAMYARGLVASLDVDDATASTALTAYKVAIGMNADASEEQVLDQLLPKNSRPMTTTALAEGSITATSSIPLRDKVAEERERITDLQARGKALGVADDVVQHAVDEGLSVGDALQAWTKDLAQKTKPVITAGPAQMDKFNEAAGALICEQYSMYLGGLTEDEQSVARQYGGSLRSKRLVDLIRMHYASHGQRIEGDDREVAQRYLSVPNDVPILTADGGGDMYSINRRGDHADMLAGLVNKALARGAIVAETSFRQYTRRVADLPDFKPRSWIDHGIFNRLDAITEDEQMKQLKMQSELQTWIKADRYANCVGLTEEMVVDDDLGGFTEILSSMSMAAVFTIQNAVIGLLAANPNTLDGNAFFSTAHKNIVTVGGVPSDVEYQKMRLLHRLNTSYGSDAPMGATLDKVIVPAALENAALQTLATGVEVKTPATDATVNTFRGSVTVVVDPYLDAFNAVGWYSAIPLEQGAGLIYAFQRGFGERGRRNEWYDASRKTRYVGLETRFGVALANWRAMVFNDGTV